MPTTLGWGRSDKEPSLRDPSVPKDSCSGPRNCPQMNVSRPKPSPLPSPQPLPEMPRQPIAPARVGRRIPQILLIGAGGFLVAISWQVVLPVLPLHLSKIGYTASQIGILVSLLSLAMGIVEMQVGHIVGWFGRRHTLLWGSVANAVCMVLV